MHNHREQDPHTCALNDLALMRIDRADVHKVNPSVPCFRGPTGIDTSPTTVGGPVVTRATHRCVVRSPSCLRDGDQPR